MQAICLPRNSPLFGLVVPPDWFSFWTGNYGWFCSMLMQSLHRILQNLAFELLIQSTKISRSSTEYTISTSLIQCVASVRNCEQIHTSVLNLIFQTSKCCWCREFVEMKLRNLQSSLVCSIILERVSLTNDERTLGWRSWLASLILNWCSILILLHQWWVNCWDKWELHGFNQFLQIMCCKKHFPIYHVCPKCLAAHLCGSEFLCIPPRTGWSGKDTNWLTWDCSNAYWFSILKISWIVYSNDSFHFAIPVSCRWVQR